MLNVNALRVVNEHYMLIAKLQLHLGEHATILISLWKLIYKPNAFA